MRWHNLARNPQIIQDMYAIVPALEAVDLEGLILYEEHVKLVVAVTLPSFPDYPPTDWSKEYSFATVILAFLELDAISISRWSTQNIVDIQIEGVMENRISLNIVSSRCSIQAIARSFEITAVDGFKRGSL